MAGTTFKTWQVPQCLTPAKGVPKVTPDLQNLAHWVHAEFDEQLDPLAVDECLNRVAARFEAKGRAFVPLLVRRYVRDELHERLRSA